MFHLDFDLNEDETRRLAESGIESGSAADKSEAGADPKESSSVHSISKAQSEAERRAKRFGKALFRTKTLKTGEEVVKVLYIK